MPNILDNYRVDRAQQKVGETINEEQSLKSILGNESQSALFATFLDAEDAASGTKLAESLKNGSLSEDEMAELTKHRQEFIDRSEGIKHVKLYVNESTLQSYLAHSPELQKVVMLAGPGGTMKALNHHMELMAMTDPDKFKEIKSKVDALHKHRTGDYFDTENKITELSKKYGVNDNKIGQILLSDIGEDEKKKAIKTELRKSLPRWKRLFVMNKRTNNVMGMQTEMVSNIGKYEMLAKDIGTALDSTVRTHDLTRKTLSEILVGDSPEKLEKGLGFKTARQELATSTTLESEWEKYVAENKLDASKSTEWKNGLDAFKAEQKIKNEEKKKKKQGGWLAVLFSLFDDKVDKFDGKIKAK